MGLPWLLLLSGAAVTWDGDHPVPERLPVAMGHSWSGGTTQKVLTFWVTQAKMPLQESPSQVSKASFFGKQPVKPTRSCLCSLISTSIAKSDLYHPRF